MTPTPVQPFKASIPAAGFGRVPCTVVAVAAEPFGLGHFIVLVEDEDGDLWAHTADSVRREPQ